MPVLGRGITGAAGGVGEGEDVVEAVVEVGLLFFSGGGCEAVNEVEDGGDKGTSLEEVEVEEEVEVDDARGRCAVGLGPEGGFC